MFRTLAGALGDRLHSLPDGETGARGNWIAWQYGVLAATRGLEPMPVGDRGYLRSQRVRRARDAGPIRFGPLGYAQAARESFALFGRLQREGVIPAGVRFQVSLPTPLAPVSVFIDLPDRAAVEPAYEQRLLEELAEIASAIPHERLAIQWDVAVEVGHLEGVWPAHFTHVGRGIVERLARLGAAVPRDVELGYHLCYGDFGHQHFVTPRDAGCLVELAGALARMDRTLGWIHMPVPVGWTDPIRFAPLGRLRLSATTRLYLGVVHQEDGIEGARRRIDLARAVVPRFGISTECGWGRRAPRTIGPLIEQHRALAAPVRDRDGGDLVDPGLYAQPGV